MKECGGGFYPGVQIRRYNCGKSLLAERDDVHQHNALVCEQLLDTREQRRKVLRVLGEEHLLWNQSPSRERSEILATVIVRGSFDEIG